MANTRAHHEAQADVQDDEQAKIRRRALVLALLLLAGMRRDVLVRIRSGGDWYTTMRGGLVPVADNLRNMMVLQHVAGINRSVVVAQRQQAGIPAVPAPLTPARPSVATAKQTVKLPQPPNVPRGTFPNQPTIIPRSIPSLPQFVPTPTPPPIPVAPSIEAVVKETLTNRTAPAKELQNFFGVVPDRLGMTDAQVAELHQMYWKSAWQTVDATGAVLDDEIRKALTAAAEGGLSGQKAYELAREAFDKAGLGNRNPWALQHLYDTMANVSYGAGQRAGTLLPGVYDAMWGYFYLTRRDDRVRPAHRAMDGTQLPKNDPTWDIWTPPCGWGCRCRLLTVFPNQDGSDPHTRPAPLVMDGPEGSKIPVLPDAGWGINFGSGSVSPSVIFGRPISLPVHIAPEVVHAPF